MPTTGPAALDERPRRRRAALLAAPWVFALALGLAALVTRPGASASPDTADTPAATAPTDAAADTAATAAPTERVPAAPTTHTAFAADALPPSTRLQVLARARAAFGTAGLTSQEGHGFDGVGGGPGDQWPIDVRVTAVAPVTDALAIATVHGLVIQWVDGGWSGPVTRAVAVPLTTAPHPRVAGPAWPITSPPVAVAAPDGQEVANPDPAVLDPLEQAGWTVDELTTVELVDGAVLRVGLVGTPPDGTEPGHHVVWLLDAPGGPRLLPLEPPPSTQEST